MQESTSWPFRSARILNCHALPADCAVPLKDAAASRRRARRNASEDDNGILSASLMLRVGVGLTEKRRFLFIQMLQIGLRGKLFDSRLSFRSAPWTILYRNDTRGPPS